MRFLRNVILEIFSEYIIYSSNVDGRDAQDARSTSQQTGIALSIPCIHAIHCNTAVQCSSLWTTYGPSVSLSVSIETETETEQEHFQIQNTED